MNTHYGVLDESLKQLYSRIKTTNNPAEMFKFLKVYLMYAENESKPGKHLYLLYNPLDISLDQKQIIKDFNSRCLGFLVKMATTSKNIKWSSEAQAYLGIAYELGLFGLNPNQSNAFSYYSVSTQQNNKYGTFRIAQAYEKGLAKHKNITNAIYFYRCSAKLGCVFGLHTYGSILIRGDLGVAKDFDTGLFYLKLAAQKASEHYPYAFYDLAQIYESRNNVVEIEPDDDYAFRLYERGANMKCPNSQYRLARAYETGELFRKQNMRISIDYYTKAANNGQIDAQYALSRYLFTGIEKILKQDFRSAYRYAVRAAVKNHGDAAFTVGEFVENGCGVKKSKFLALWWYTIATTNGNKHAVARMNKLRYEINMKNDGPTRFGLCWCCFK